MEYFPPKVSGTEVLISPSPDVLAEGKDLWNTSVVAQVIGNSPNLSYVQYMVKKLWQHEGNIDIIPSDDGLFILNFQNASARDRIWVLFRNVPLELFTLRG